MSLIKREILKDILNHLDAKEITLINGARQVGKTTLMNEVKEILENRKVKTLYLNLDIDSDFVHFQSQDRLLQKIRLELGTEKGVIFIDEIQRKENSGLFLKGLYDRGDDNKFIVSGSGSMELKEKIHESLTGRKRVFELSTVTFREFVNYKTGYKYENNLSSFFDLESEKVTLLLEEYLSFGGYPRIVTESNKNEKNILINEIYDSYLKKDIAYLLKIKRPDVFTKLIQLLAHQTGSVINYSTLALDAGISVPTLKRYIWYAENTFIIKLINPYFKNKRKEIRKSQTVYFYDTGFRNYALNQFGVDIRTMQSGFIFQNFVFTILKDLLPDNNYTIHFWRTADAAEVDFVINTGVNLIPIEVKFTSLRRDKVSRSLRNFIDSYNPEKVYIINLDYSGEITINKTVVKFLPYYKLYDESFK
jgi:uncharacterized protein